MKTIVILGTSRSDGNTLAAVKDLCPFKEYELIDLRRLVIQPYQYEGPSVTDDFLAVAKKMEAADNIIFATPVYWYAMSGVLKAFFDRLSDLLSFHRTIGRALKGKKTFLIATGSDSELPPGFEEPFRLTSEYFGMTFERSFYKSVK
jgi:multimeric flavodoxin WrbA